ncbi:hypothetical protein M2475_001096 [Breznakia sp. PF5-3]|uniref:hypothetical protein n=1 Tax=unclassified Breznakia TaxID=2623764 RepID=UPI00240681F0|nr:MULTISPECIES: hypothetical protein [unclassified Breznakia]MDF9824306.1 hypothetical protein [Breznakia sp. PM6-1]MDF9835530.1 hypothetical protein [Breznakia sp. PF5-3]MDF9838797.1 hypothetical protein [Breznakia sp. PFB2-8]MDF9860815.1 hypothetical protein [Breznakia sp. PH5-24]
MKKIILGLLVCFLFACGNGSKEKDEVKIKLNENKGEVVALTLDELITKMENEESFVFLFSQTYCGSCMSFFAESDEYTKEIGLTLYDVTLDSEKKTEAEQQAIFDKHFSDFSATPTIYFVSNGEVKDSLNSSEEDVSLDSYKKFLKENKVIK